MASTWTLDDHPPAETGEFRKPDLVELATLDPAIKLDIRYASTNNFLSTPVYSQARAFLQRPAAEALLRAHRRLKQMGFGLLIHDAYRPWYVTKIFWEATPQDKRIFVANPSGHARALLIKRVQKQRSGSQKIYWKEATASDNSS